MEELLNENKPLELNPSLLRMLWVWVERDPYFQSITCDESDLSYPEFSCSVVSLTGKNPPIKPGETRLTCLSEALAHFHHLQFEERRPIKCSILIHEGTYFNSVSFHGTTLGQFGTLLPSGNRKAALITVEIVGTQNVRLVCLGDHFIGIINGIHVNFKNVTIYNRNMLPGISALQIGQGANVCLNDVRISTPHSPAVFVADGGKLIDKEISTTHSKLIMKNCVTSMCYQSIYVSNKAEVSLTNCHIS